MMILLFFIYLITITDSFIIHYAVSIAAILFNLISMGRKIKKHKSNSAYESYKSLITAFLFAIIIITWDANPKVESSFFIIIITLIFIFLLSICGMRYLYSHWQVNTNFGKAYIIDQILCIILWPFAIYGKSLIDEISQISNLIPIPQFSDSISVFCSEKILIPLLKTMSILFTTIKTGFIALFPTFEQRLCFMITSILISIVLSVFLGLIEPNSRTIEQHAKTNTDC